MGSKLKENALIVYVGSMDPQSNSYRRFRTLGEMGYNMKGVDVDGPVFKSPFSSVHYRYNLGPGIVKLGAAVRQAVKQHKPDVLWLDNKIFIPYPVLKKIREGNPDMLIVNLITDDVTGHAKPGWRLTLKAAPLVDFHFVQRMLNLVELKEFGARKVSICYRSYDPVFHRRLHWTEEERKPYHCQVGFIGTCEAPREEMVAYLISQGIPVQVTGNDWPKGKRWDMIKPHYKGPSVYGEEYIKAINGMDIALHFLRHSNRDEQDSRTFEIPACGAFMLAERSELHLKLFEENREAVFFTTKEELLEKVTYFNMHPEQRKQIADAGMARCKSSGYSHESRLREVMQKLNAND